MSLARPTNFLNDFGQHHSAVLCHFAMTFLAAKDDASSELMSRNLQISLLRIALPTLGFITLLVPLALWIAWSKAMFYATLLVGAATVSGFV